MILQLEQLIAICPHTPRTRLDLFVEPLNAAIAEFEIDSIGRCAMFLAHVAHETMDFRRLEEIASGAAYDNNKHLGNTDPEAIAIARSHDSTPGPWWKGHGGLQVTGYKNHKLCGEALELDLLNEPLLLCEPIGAMRSAGWFWAVGAGLNLGKAAHDHGIPDGVNLNEIADQGDFPGTTLAINGGLNGQDFRLNNFRLAQGALT